MAIHIVSWVSVAIHDVSWVYVAATSGFMVCRYYAYAMHMLHAFL